MQRICILALIGLPAAGKTQFCHWLLQQPILPFNAVHLCYDDFLDFSPNVIPPEEAYKQQRLEINKILSHLVSTLKSDHKLPTDLAARLKTSITPSKSEDFLIVCDDNNYYTSMRQYLYKYCRSNSCAYAQIFFDCSLALAQTRNAARRGKFRIPAHILERMSLHLEAPSASKHDWEALTLTWNATSTEYSQTICLPFILNAFDHVLKPPVVEEPPSKALQEYSPVHELDLSLRRRIKELVVAYAGDKQVYASSLNAQRLQILQTFAAKTEAILKQEGLEIYIDMLK